MFLSISCEFNFFQLTLDLKVKTFVIATANK